MTRAVRMRRHRQRRDVRRRQGAGRARLGTVLALAVATLLLVAAGGAGAAYGIYQMYADDLIPPEVVIAQNSWQGSIFFDRHGEFLYQAVDPLVGLHEPVPLSNISPYMIAATIAVEDASFYHNPGVNFRGLARAFLENFTPFGPGFLKGSGGSSITQQLVRNLYISEEERFERKIGRKIKEIVLALELKRLYDDDQILEWYLNQVFYGNNAYGVEAAAQRYFGKSARDLTLAEAALLAGIPQSPALYSPIDSQNRERAEARRQQVLDLMLKHLDEINDIPPLKRRGVVITAEEIEAAKQAQVELHPSTFPIEAPHFVFYARDQVVKMCKKGLFKPPKGIGCDEVINKGGLRIFTTVDLGLQELGQQIINEELAAEVWCSRLGRNASREECFNGHNAALVAIVPETGEILAIVGSRDYFREDIDGEVNIATSPRSHGSAMKVFTYLTAFSRGWVPSTLVEDAPLTIGGHTIHNWDFQHQGWITVRKALAESVNTAAVRTVLAMGEESVVRTAVTMGLTCLGADQCRGLTEDPINHDCGPVVTLGACEVKLLDMAFAFATLANNGLMVGMRTVEDLPKGFRSLDPTAILRIEDREGRVLYQYEPEAEQVIRPAFAYMITDVLYKDAIKWSGLTVDRPAASKTGTQDKFQDNVVLGYTPDLAVGVWMGNTDGAPMAQGAFSFAGAGPIWRRFMREAHAYLGLSPHPFRVPGDVIFAQCGDREEVFAAGVPVSKGGICESPTGGAPPAVTPTPTPMPSPTPQLTPTQVPIRTPTATPVPSPVPTPTPTPEPEPTSGIPVTITPSLLTPPP